jgi:uncharacterized protein YvpB
MTIEVENQINTIKEIVDNSMHVMINEDKIFNFAKENKNNIASTDTKQKSDIRNIIKTLLKLNILKTNNIMAKEELEASAKLVVHLVREENCCEIENILKYLSNL